MNRPLLLVVFLVVCLLTAPSLFASADLNIQNFLSVSTVRAGSSIGVFYEIHYSGPDTASNVIVTLTVGGATASMPCSAGCAISDIPSGQSRSITEGLTFPLAAGFVTMTASVSSSAADPNPADNTHVSTVTVSTDPEGFLTPTSEFSRAIEVR
ncbi:MAG: hypothetical protein QOC81_3702 [Thermoanaerobaculia bacterium]|jgi:hypothetical protein|nr:hypothetical protein [Thermoanaerobaculia bacterium]